jgi:predicted PurR-regulated permease PerM
MPAAADKQPAEQHTPEPFKRRVLIGAMIVIALIILLYFLWQAVYVLLLIFAGVLLAVLLRGLAEFTAKHTRLSVGWSLAIVTLAIVALLVGIVWLAAPPISRQVEQLSEQLPQSIELLRERASQFTWGKWLVEHSPATQPVDQHAEKLVGQAGGFLAALFDVVVALVVIVFVAIYLAAEPELYTKGILRLVPKRYREHGARVLGSVRYTLHWWLIGQGVTMVIIGTLTSIGLWAIGIPLWFLLGLLAALFNFIPNFGPLVSYVPAVLLALAMGPTKAVWVTALFLAAQTLEGYVLTPMIQRRAVLLPPALTITVQVLLGVLVGSLGVMLAAPLTAAALVLIKMLYVEDVLGDEMKTPDDELPRSELPPVPK